MPVSPLPLLLPIIFIVLLIRGARRGLNAFLKSCAWVVAIIACVTIPFYVPGWLLMVRASSGNARSQYLLAKWYENHTEKIGALILWPLEPNVEKSYVWVEKSAAQNYPPALYALGIRLKYGLFVPEPPNWTGPSGNVFEQPEKGQPYIDHALKLGYKPLVEENLFYNFVFRESQIKEKL